MLLRSATAFIWYLLSCSEGFNSVCRPSPPFWAQKDPFLHVCLLLTGCGVPHCSFLLRMWVFQFITTLAELSTNFWFSPQWMYVLFFLSIPNPGVNSAYGLSRPYSCWRCCCRPPGAVSCPKAPVRPVFYALFGGHHESSLHVHCLLCK